MHRRQVRDVVERQAAGGGLDVCWQMKDRAGGEMDVIVINDGWRIDIEPEARWNVDNGGASPGRSSDAKHHYDPACSELIVDDAELQICINASDRRERCCEGG
jgi:hypothetical protein